MRMLGNLPHERASIGLGHPVLGLDFFFLAHALHERRKLSRIFKLG